MTETLQKGGDPKDRRRVPRFPFEAEAEITEAATGAKTQVHTSELSLFGCYLRVRNPLPCGTQVFVKINTGMDFFEAPATIAYSQENHGNGVAFHDVKPHFVRTLQKWLAEAMRQLTNPTDTP